MPNCPTKLDHSIQTLKKISKDLHKQPPKSIADVYLAAIELICHLKVDQMCLHRISTQGEKAECPPPQDIPAISAVIHDGNLFRALLQCLQTTTGVDAAEVEASSNIGQVGIIHHHAVARKRSLSVAGDLEVTSNRLLPNKVPKLVHSPVPTWQHKAMGERKPQLHVQSLAATILFTAFQHLDHWPAPLVKAYAEDCFGPRLWVDEEHCQFLVSNLRLAHLDHSEYLPGAAIAIEDASRIEETYRRWFLLLTSVPPEQDPVIASSPSSERRGSMSSSCSLHQPLRSLDSLGKTKKDKLKHSSAEECDSKTEEPVGELNDDDDDGSSSGEEDEEFLVTADSSHGDLVTETRSNQSSESKKGEGLYPIMQRRLNLERVRQRYFASNLEFAHELISASLSNRLDIRTKQNSSLLQSLPSFTSISAVRSLVAANLQKWLQSPALAGLARNLFTSTVNSMKNIDPPLEDDLRVIDSILAMRLKVNQLSAHIDNVKAIATKVPTGSVANYLYASLLREAIPSNSSSSSLAESDQMKMIIALHGTVPSELSYDAMAEALLQMLVSPGKGADIGSSSRLEREQLVRKLKTVIRSMSFGLGLSFDGFKLMEALLSLDVSCDSWTSRDEEDKARLMFQCVTLAVSQSLPRKKRSKNGKGLNGSSPSIDESVAAVRKSFYRTRKLLLAWCCTDYGPRYNSKGRLSRPRRNGVRRTEDVVGAGIPDYNSALGPATELKIPSWLNTMRCLLFIEDSESALMKHFVLSDKPSAEDEGDWREEQERIKTCWELGTILTDEMIWIVLRSAENQTNGIESNMALQLLENMFEACRKAGNGSLRVSDPMIVWELYNLVTYTPPKPRSSKQNGSDDAEEDEDASDVSNQINGHVETRLAYPGLWWRATILALLMSANSPDKIGRVVWKEHPTLQALLKMVTSNRYRFPTVDCDEKTRELMKAAEQKARDEESAIAELLFLPPKKEKKQEKKVGSRVSRRLQKKKEEKEAAEELAETSTRRKLLRAAQRSIMLWDPDGPARKPPREAAEILMEVEDNFMLSERFQNSLDPDFLLLSIGQTDRASIERAYDWLIPIISSLPNAITRLHSSASCFLLLRAYGSSNDEKTQLKQLSAPLLKHVEDSLQGRLSESDSLKAFDLLMSDVASHNPDRRRCARRVLHDALAAVGDNSAAHDAWMLTISQLKHARSLVRPAIQYMSTAATFERGRVLRSLILALEKHTAFAESNGVLLDCSFPHLLVDLISSRPSVFADAMDAFPDLLSLAVRVVRAELLRCDHSDSDNETIVAHSVVIKPRPALTQGSREIVVSLSLMKTIAVLLSIWRDGNQSQDASVAVEEMVASLLNTDGELNEKGEADETCGLASARLKKNGDVAMNVESWIMLAKARSDVIARRAALSAPARFLPRLLLCSGLPASSLTTMIDRLGRLGDSSDDRDSTFSSLLAPATTSEWDIGRVGHRRDTNRRLLGRLAAYLRLHPLDFAQNSISTSFLDWLSTECERQTSKPKKAKPKKLKVNVPESLGTVVSASSILAELTASSCFAEPDLTMSVDGVELPSLFGPPDNM